MASFKLRRKQSKYKQILKSDLNINAKDVPTNFLMIGNAGLVSGVQYEELAKLFVQFGNVEKILMIPKKSYSFVVYSSVEEAKNAYNAINGHIKLNNMDGPLYLVYCDSVPSEFEYPSMNSLPEGLTLIPDFVTCDEEDVLLKCINWDTTNQESAKSLKHRRVKHYGFEFRYDTNNVDKDSPLTESIPEECCIIYNRLKELGQPLPWSPDQMTVNQYQKGQGIPGHVDTHSAFESPLLSLSLGSQVVMEFRRGSEHLPVLLPRRSLLIMDGEARYAWSHGITPRTMDVVLVEGENVGRGLTVCERGCRTSLTLRRVRHGPCQCQYAAQCDSQHNSTYSDVTERDALMLERLYVHQVYDNIACHFSETRTKVWPNVQEFLLSFKSGSVLIDAGCGNGKYFGVNPNVFQVGFDHSAGLAGITSGRGHQVFVGDCLSVPLRDGSADGLISIAVLHHISTPARRLDALREMTRVLVPGGRALVTVWAKDQTKKNLTAYLKQDRKNRRKEVVQSDTSVSETENRNSRGFLNIDNLNSPPAVQEFSPHGGSDKLNGSGENVKDNPGYEKPEFKLPVHTARTEFQHQDVFVPWKVKSKDPCENKKSVFLRYYHVFEENELSQLCSEITGVHILQTYYTEGNWCVIFEKLNS